MTDPRRESRLWAGWYIVPTEAEVSDWVTWEKEMLRP